MPTQIIGWIALGLLPFALVYTILLIVKNRKSYKGSMGRARARGFVVVPDDATEEQLEAARGRAQARYMSVAVPAAMRKKKATRKLVISIIVTVVLAATAIIGLFPLLGI
jgi:hypothetical protein